MRILFDALQAGNRSGTGAYARGLLRALMAVEGGHAITALWPSHLPAPAPPGGSAHEVSAVPARGAIRRVILEQWGMRRKMRAADFDVAHYPASVGPLLPVPGAVVTVHDLAFLRHPEWFPRSRALYLRHAVPRGVRNAQRLVADSEAAAADLASLLGVPRERIDVAPLAVETSYRPLDARATAEARQEFDLPERFFLFVGTLEPRKNLPRLIRAFSAHADRHDYGLVLAGRPGWRMRELNQALASCRHRERVHLPGFIPEQRLCALYNAATVFVWPSLYEGFGLPPLAAMACGVPVLTSNCSSLPELVGGAALTVDPSDDRALADSMLRLAEESELRNALRELGLRRAAEFSWERTAAMTLDTYRRVSGGS